MGGEGQPEVASDKSRIVISIIILIAVIILGIVWYTSGQTAVTVMVKKWLVYFMIAVVVGLIIFAVMKFLQKSPIDLVHNDWKDIVDSAILSKPPMVRDLYATGDKEHGEFRLGHIIGYCQLQSYKDLDLIAGMTTKQVEELESRGGIPSQYIVKEDCFVFKKFPFPFSLFEEPKVLRCLEDEHSQIIGNVKIYAVSVVAKYKYYWPNRAHLDIARIDLAVIREAWRGGIHQFLKDSVAINQRASGLDAEFKKDMDKRKLLKVPTMLGGQEEQGR